MKNIFLATILFFLMSFTATVFGQTTKTNQPAYKTAIGAKFFPLALSVKSMTGGKKNGFEFLGYFKDGFRITGLFEHYGALNVEGNLKWYIGGGGHLGFADNAHGSNTKVGADGIIGLDYKFMHLPLNLSLDWQPSLGFGDDNSFTANWGGIGVRFCF